MTESDRTYEVSGDQLLVRHPEGEIRSYTLKGFPLLVDMNTDYLISSLAGSINGKDYRTDVYRRETLYQAVLAQQFPGHDQERFVGKAIKGTPVEPTQSDPHGIDPEAYLKAIDSVGSVIRDIFY